MSTFKVGQVGLIVTANKLGDDRQGYFSYVGINKGFHCNHHLFRSINGGYLISYTDIDFRCGNVTFTEDGKPFKKSMRNAKFSAIKGYSIPQFLANPSRLYSRLGL